MTIDETERFVYDQDRQLLKFHGRTLPAIKNWTDQEEEAMSDFSARTGYIPHVHRRVRIPFENGWQLSVVWGSLSYSDNHDHSMGWTDGRGFGGRPNQEFVEEPREVEVAVLCPPAKAIETTIDFPDLVLGGELKQKGASFPHSRELATWADGDTVCGYVTPEHLSTIVDYVMTIPSDVDLDDVLIPSESSAPTLKTYVKALFGDGDQT